MAVDTMSLNWSKHASSANSGQVPKASLEAASPPSLPAALGQRVCASWVCVATQTQKKKKNLSYRPDSSWMLLAERQLVLTPPPPRMLLAGGAEAENPPPARMLQDEEFQTETPPTPPRMLLAGGAEAENPPPARMLQDEEFQTETPPTPPRMLLAGGADAENPPVSPPMSPQSPLLPRHLPSLTNQTSPPLPRIQRAEFALAPASRMWEPCRPPYPSHPPSPACPPCVAAGFCGAPRSHLPCALPSLCSCLAARSVSLCSASCCSALSSPSTWTSASRERASVRSGSASPCERLGQPLRAPLLHPFARAPPLPRMMQPFAETPPLH